VVVFWDEGNRTLRDVLSKGTKVNLTKCPKYYMSQIPHLVATNATYQTIY